VFIKIVNPNNKKNLFVPKKIFISFFLLKIEYATNGGGNDMAKKSCEPFYYYDPVTYGKKINLF